MYCSNCGNKIDYSSKFCANCGAKIEKNSADENKIESSTEQIINSNSDLKTKIKKGVKIAYIYDGVLIQVVNKWTKEDLYINDTLVDQHYTGFTAIWGKTLILKAIDYPFKSGKKTIQVFCKSELFSNKFMLCIDNVYVAGDKI